MSCLVMWIGLVHAMKSSDDWAAMLMACGVTKVVGLRRLMETAGDCDTQL